MNEQRKFYSVEQFSSLDLRQKIEAFVSLPVMSQKVLISLSAYFAGVGEHLITGIRDPLAQQINLAKAEGRELTEFEISKIKTTLKWSPEEFDQGLNTLLQMQYVTKKSDLVNENCVRYEIVPEIKRLVNVELRQVWEEQQKNKK